VFAKLAITIVALGAFACALLAMRQSRLQAASEIAQAQLRIQKLDDELLRTRSEIARRLAPHELEALTRTVGPLKPIIVGEPLPSLEELEGEHPPQSATPPADPSNPQAKPANGPPLKPSTKPPAAKKETKSKPVSPPRPTAIASTPTPTPRE
jgi:hypothetical protein